MLSDDLLFNKMLDELASSGCAINSDSLVHSKFSDSDNDILMKYMGKFQSLNYNELVISCFRQTKKKYISDLLLNEFFNTNISETHYRWTIGEALYTVGYKRNLYEYMKIVTNKKYGKARQMVVMLVGKIKDKSILNTLLIMLFEYDYDILPQLIWCLGRFDEEKIPKSLLKFMQELTSDIGAERFKEDLIFLKKNNPDYEYVDIDGFYGLIQKEANKILIKSNIIIKRKSIK